MSKPSKIFIYQSAGSVYWFEDAGSPFNEGDELGDLCYAPISSAGLVDFDESGLVEEDLVGDEEILGGGEFKTLHELYEYLRSMRQKGLL